MKRVSTYAITFVLAAGVLAACAGGAGTNTVEIRPVGNEMRYETTEFSVKAGEQVRLVFVNTATSAAMHHNVVILTDPTAVERVGTAALTASANDYIPEDDAILAHTAMAAPGATVEVTFTAPTEPGDYTFICTYPGHYLLMRGVMRVTA
jgi:azurin